MLLLRKSPGNAGEGQQKISDRRERIWNKFLKQHSTTVPSFFLTPSLPPSLLLVLPPFLPLLLSFLSSFFFLKLLWLTKYSLRGFLKNCFTLKAFTPLLWTYSLNPYLLLAPPELSYILLPKYMVLLRSLWECSNVLAFVSYLVKWGRPKFNPHKEKENM